MTSHPYPQYFKSIVVVLGAEPLKGMSPHTSIACVRRWEKAKSTGRHSPPQMSLKSRSMVLPMAVRQGYTKSPLSSRSRRTLAEMGRPRVWQSSPLVPTYATCAESSPAAPSSPTAATPGLPQWSLVETTFATAASTYCPLASAWVSSAG